MNHRKLIAFALALVALAGLAAAANGVVVGKRTTSIVSPPPEAGVAADGSSDNSTFSQDSRAVKYMAYDTVAGNIVSGDTNGKRDVVLLERGSGDGNVGGTLSLASVNSAGQQGNGDSQKPAIDGKNPHCVVFESTATNLAKGDSSPDSDIFLRDLRSKKTELMSDKRSGAKNASIDDECEFVTYDVGGKVFVRDLEKDTTTPIARGANAEQQANGKGVAYERGGQIYYTPFQRVFNKGNPKVKKTTNEALVSKGNGGAGNGISKNAQMDANGHYVAFESTSTNLCQGLCKGVNDDENGNMSDVFRATISPKAPTNDKMEMVSYSFAVQAQGNGPSNNPDMSGAGENIVFDSEATNLKESNAVLVADGNGPVRDIYYWNFPKSRMEGNVSRESRDDAVVRELGTGQPYNGPSTNPSTSQRSNYIGFSSLEAGASGEVNGAGIVDVFLRFLGGGPPGSV